MEKKQTKKKKQQSDLVAEVTNGMRNNDHKTILSDILGSYTGNPQDGGKPEQDADDL